MRKTKALALIVAGMMAANSIAAAQPYGDNGYGNNDNRYDNRDNGNGDRYDNRDDRNGNRDGRGQERYRHDYRSDDDAYYNGCQQQRASNQTGGLIIGAIAGGLLGNSIARGPSRGAGTVLGAIAGGAIGASIGGNLNCDDRGFAYRAYYSGFERGRPHARYDWRNPKSGAYGYLQVGDYYRDHDGFRCATYTQTITVHGRPEVARGHACKQRDGAWVFVD